MKQDKNSIMSSKQQAVVEHAKQLMQRENAAEQALEAEDNCWIYKYTLRIDSVLTSSSIEAIAAEFLLTRDTQSDLLDQFIALYTNLPLSCTYSMQINVKQLVWYIVTLVAADVKKSIEAGYVSCEPMSEVNDLHKIRVLEWLATDAGIFATKLWCKYSDKDSGMDGDYWGDKVKDDLFIQSFDAEVAAHLAECIASEWSKDDLATMPVFVAQAIRYIMAYTKYDIYQMYEANEDNILVVADEAMIAFYDDNLKKLMYFRAIRDKYEPLDNDSLLEAERVWCERRLAELRKQHH